MELLILVPDVNASRNNYVGKIGRCGYVGVCGWRGCGCVCVCREGYEWLAMCNGVCTNSLGSPQIKNMRIKAVRRAMIVLICFLFLPSSTNTLFSG